MSDASITERSTGRRIADSLLDAVAAPLSQFDRSTSYSRHLEQSLLADGKKRLLGCMQQALAADLHGHYAVAREPLVRLFGELEEHYDDWTRERIRRAWTGLTETLSRAAPDGREGNHGLDPEAYFARARWFLTRYHILLELDARQRMARPHPVIAERIIFELPACLRAFEDLHATLSRGLRRPGAEGIRGQIGLEHDYFVIRLCGMWLRALQARGWPLGKIARNPPRPDGAKSGQPTEKDKPPKPILDHQQIDDLAATLGKLHPDAPLPRADGDTRPWLGLIGAVLRLAKTAAESDGQGGRERRLPPSVIRTMEAYANHNGKLGPRSDRIDADDARTCRRALFIDGARSQGPTPGVDRHPIDADYLRVVRSSVNRAVHWFDGLNEINPWDLDVLEGIERPALAAVFSELVEHSPEPVKFSRLVDILESHLPARHRPDPARRPEVRRHLRNIIVCFNQIIDAYEIEYRSTLEPSAPQSAERPGEGEAPAARDVPGVGRQQFGWGRLWPGVWSDDAHGLWTDRAEARGGSPLPVTFKLVLTCQPNAATVDETASVMLVPLFPLQRTLEDSQPLQDLLEYMHSGSIAILRNDAQVSRTPYHLAALTARVGDGLLTLTRLGQLALDLVLARTLAVDEESVADRGPDPPAARTPAWWRETIWRRSVSWFVRLGAQRHRLNDKLRARLVRVLPSYLPFEEVERQGDALALKGSGLRADLRRRVVLATTPVPHSMWRSTVEFLGRSWREWLAARITGDRSGGGADRGLDVGVLIAEMQGELPKLGRLSSTRADELIEALEERYPRRRIRHQICRLLADTLADLLGDVGSTRAGPIAAERVARLELFMLASLFYDPARPRRDASEPRRMEQRSALCDLYTLVARHRHFGRRPGLRGHTLRARIIAELVYAPYRLTVDDTHRLVTEKRVPKRAERAECRRNLRMAWGEVLDAWVADLAEALFRGTGDEAAADGSRGPGGRPRSDSVMAAVEGVMPPTAAQLLDEALGRGRPSTYSTLRVLFWDAVRWPDEGTRR